MTGTCTPWQSIPCHSPAAFCAAYLQASGQLPLPSCQLLQQLLQCVHSQLPPFHLWLSSPTENSNIDQLVGICHTRVCHAGFCQASGCLHQNCHTPSMYLELLIRLGLITSDQVAETSENNKCLACKKEPQLVSAELNTLSIEHN